MGVFCPRGVGVYEKVGRFSCGTGVGEPLFVSEPEDVWCSELGRTVGIYGMEEGVEPKSHGEAVRSQHHSLSPF
jgi:hypothetical protein